MQRRGGIKAVGKISARFDYSRLLSGVGGAPSDAERTHCLGIHASSQAVSETQCHANVSLAVRGRGCWIRLRDVNTTFHPMPDSSEIA